MFLEYSLQEDREQDTYYSKAHEYKDTERDYLGCAAGEPGKTDTESNCSEKNRRREIGDGEQERVLNGLFDCFIEPGDKWECIGCGCENREQEEESRVHGPLVLFGERIHNHMYLKPEKSGKKTIDNEKACGFDEILLIASEELTEYRRILACSYFNADSI